jgi:signal transduction histidine kinase
VLGVTDDGPGPGEPPTDVTTGVGLLNLRERLASLYGARARLELVATPGGGAIATVRLPYRDLEARRG